MVEVVEGQVALQVAGVAEAVQAAEVVEAGRVVRVAGVVEAGQVAQAAEVDLIVALTFLEAQEVLEVEPLGQKMKVKRLNKVSMRAKPIRLMLQERIEIGTSWLSPTGWAKVNAHLLESLQKLLLLFWRDLLPELADPLKNPISHKIGQLIPTLYDPAYPLV